MQLPAHNEGIKTYLVHCCLIRHALELLAAQCIQQCLTLLLQPGKGIIVVAPHISQLILLRPSEMYANKSVA